MYFCNFSPEQIAFAAPDGFNTCGYDAIYRLVGEGKILGKPLSVEESELGVTVHSMADGGYLASVLNYSDKAVSPTLKIKKGFKIAEILYGNADCIPPCDGVILRLEKE